MGVGYNNSTQKYYWNDGNAIETLEPQPTVVKANGNTAWFLDEGSNTPGKRVLKVVDSTERGSEAQSNPISNITSLWLGVGYNECTNKYYWNDGNAIETLEPQPTVLNETGRTAWFFLEGPNTPGKRVLKTVDASPGGAPYVRGYVCGQPGRQ
uniref:C-type lectin domain-containing protein n=1 Tax=Caenorhabditis tropicalis TaxID=1561998 RepID=A0A1I7V476_9PELO